MKRKCFYISELAESNLIRAASADKRNPSQQLDFMLCNLKPKEPKNVKRPKTRR